MPGKKANMPGNGRHRRNGRRSEKIDPARPRVRHKKRHLRVSDAPPAMMNMKSGKLRALAVTSEKRWPFTPELPTLAEEGVTGFAAANWWGILFPRGVPQPIVDKVNAALVKALTTPEVKTRLGDLGVEARPGTAEQFGEFMAKESAKYAKLIKDANIKAE
ncbi:MAG: tripartite tricarboxylate transporter substrate-binding protein [Betaproteobacteria bacterium]